MHLTNGCSYATSCVRCLELREWVVEFNVYDRK